LKPVLVGVLVDIRRAPLNRSRRRAPGCW
jgi:hypothetical protein